MCAIFGLVSRTGEMPQVLDQMSSLLAHRGPDGEGFVLFPEQGPARPRGGESTTAASFTTPSHFRPSRPLAAGDYDNVTLAFGHRRLSIVDLSPMGHQPMAAADLDIWITYNGEIYNHIELRAELEAAGHRFASHSDTAVILAAYQEWGVECLQRFNGMFAFVIHDRRRGILFLARDRFGVKPMNMWTDGSTFAFASEIKAFLALPTFSPRPFIPAVKRYLTDGPMEWTEETLFEGVRKLPPASYILAKPSELLDGSAVPVRWWALAPNLSKEPFNPDRARALADEYRERLGAAVRLRLRADVKIGSALSGGLDSSSIVWLMAEALRAQGCSELQETFSSVYRTPGLARYDESFFIEKVGGQLGVSVNTIEPDPANVPLEHEKLIWAMDTPPDSTLMSSWHTFMLVKRRGIKVTLDGQGADEQMGGYLHYLPHALVGRPPAETAKAAARLIRSHPVRMAWGSIAFAAFASLIPAERFPNSRQRLTAQMLPQGLNAHLCRDATGSLGNLLHYADRTSMAFSVESRAPFLDVNLAEFLARTPEAYKIHDGWTKHLGRAAMASRLPDDVTWRRDKMGWPVPEEVWEQGALSDWFSSASAAQADFDSLGLGEEFKAALNAPDITRRVRALNLATWRRLFIDGGWRTMEMSDQREAA